MDRNQQSTHPAIGEAFGGGFFAGLIRIGSATYGLIVAPKLAGEISGEWGPRDTVEGAGSFFDGVANTQAMAYAGSDVAALVRGLVIGGNTDWYIPSRDELEICYRNLRPTDADNVCWCGDNPSAYLPSYAYTPDTPSQTAVEAFREEGAEAFNPSWYWSSTQYAGYASNAWGQGFDDGYQGYYDNGYASNAWGQGFDDGYQGYYDKGDKGRVRAVRRFLID